MDTLNIYVKQPKRQYDSPIAGLVEGCPAFAVFSEDEKANITASGWSRSKTPTFSKVENSGFSIKIIDLESRDEGGRAYKVIDQHNRIFDLRERVLIDIFHRFGVLPNGVVPTSFKWVKDGSHMLLVPEDSEWAKKAERMAVKCPLKSHKVSPGWYSNKKETEIYRKTETGEWFTCYAYGDTWRKYEQHPPNTLYQFTDEKIIKKIIAQN